MYFVFTAYLLVSIVSTHMYKVYYCIVIVNIHPNTVSFIFVSLFVFELISTELVTQEQVCLVVKSGRPPLLSLSRQLLSLSIPTKTVMTLIRIVLDSI